MHETHVMFEACPHFQIANLLTAHLHPADHLVDVHHHVEAYPQGHAHHPCECNDQSHVLNQSVQMQTI